jgi:hypothetical protein
MNGTHKHVYCATYHISRRDVHKRRMLAVVRHTRNASTPNALRVSKGPTNLLLPCFASLACQGNAVPFPRLAVLLTHGRLRRRRNARGRARDLCRLWRGHGAYASHLLSHGSCATTMRPTSRDGLTRLCASGQGCGTAGEPDRRELRLRSGGPVISRGAGE